MSDKQDAGRLHFQYCKIHNEADPYCSCGLTKYVDAAVAEARREERGRLEKAAQGMRSVLRPLYDYAELTEHRRVEVRLAMQAWDDAIRPPTSAPEGTT